MIRCVYVRVYVRVCVCVCALLWLQSTPQDPFFEVKLKSGVKEITATEVLLADGTGIKYGMNVWAAGIGPVPVVLDLIKVMDSASRPPTYAQVWPLCPSVVSLFERMLVLQTFLHCGPGDTGASGCGKLGSWAVSR